MEIHKYQDHPYIIIKYINAVQISLCYDIFLQY